MATNPWKQRVEVMSGKTDKDLAKEALTELYKSAIEFYNKADALKDESFRNKLVDIFENIADEISCALIEAEGRYMITLEQFLETRKENLEKYKAFVESRPEYPTSMYSEQWFNDFSAWEDIEMYYERSTR